MGNLIKHTIMSSVSVKWVQDDIFECSNVCWGRLLNMWNTCSPQEFHLGKVSLSCWKTA